MSRLQAAALKRGIKGPSESTLKRYGLELDDWLGLLRDQKWLCPICERDASTLTLNTDHQHVAGWDRMEPEARRRYVRGVLCAHCNHRKVHSRMESPTAFRIARYFKRYEARRDA